MLIERLRQTALDPLTNPRVKRKIQTLATVWEKDYENVRGMDRLAHLNRNLPALGGRSGHGRSASGTVGTASSSGGSGSGRRRRTVGEGDFDNGDDSFSSRRRDKRRDEADVDDYTSSSRSATKKRSSKRRQGAGGVGERNRKAFDMAKEKPKLNSTIAEANTAATNLKNALQLVNREVELSTENDQATKCFDRCKSLRRQILRYIQVVESEEYIGSLIHANEELIGALKLYQKMSKPLGEESDSDWNIESKVRHLNVSDSEDDGSDFSDSESFGDDDYDDRRQAQKKQELLEPPNPDNPFDDSHVIAHTPEFEKGRPF